MSLLACSLSGGELAPSVAWGRAGGVAWVFCPPLVGAERREYAQYPAFASQHPAFAPKRRSDFFGLFVSFGSRISLTEETGSYF